MIVRRTLLALGLAACGGPAPVDLAVLDAPPAPLPEACGAGWTALAAPLAGEGTGDAAALVLGFALPEVAPAVGEALVDGRGLTLASGDGARVAQLLVLRFATDEVAGGFRPAARKAAAKGSARRAEVLGADLVLLTTPDALPSACADALWTTYTARLGG